MVVKITPELLVQNQLSSPWKPGGAEGLRQKVRGTRGGIAVEGRGE